MIRFANVTKAYSGVSVVDDLSLEIPRGELCVLIGLSGCGKSTTLKMVNRLIEPTQGSIFINDEPVVSWRPEILRRKIGYVIQDVGLFPHWTVEQNIAVVLKLLKWRPAQIRDRVTELLELFNLEEDQYRHKYPYQLSGGQAQRVGVARALASDPDILLMDEPFAALDPITRETLQLELARIQQAYNKTIIFVTHDIDEAMRLANRIVMMDKGRCLQSDTPEVMLDNPANLFVQEFIGSDRGLRRLSRVSVIDGMKPVRSLSLDDSVETAHRLASESNTTWVIDSDGKLVGWLGDIAKHPDCQTLADCLVKTTPSFPLSPGSLMKEALSRMLWQSVKCVPVVDENARLLGEVRFEDLLSLKGGRS